MTFEVGLLLSRERPTSVSTVAPAIASGLRSRSSYPDSRPRAPPAAAAQLSMEEIATGEQCWFAFGFLEGGRGCGIEIDFGGGFESWEREREV